MSLVVLVLSMLAMGYCNGQNFSNITRCDQFPKIDVPSIKTLVDNSPFVYDYSLTPTFDCTSKAITYPARGTTNYNATVLNVKGSSVIVFEFKVGSDKKSMDNTVCNTGEKSVWYFAVAQFNSKGGFYCVYTCNNTEFEQFVCASNNNGTSPKELETVEMARKVSNGYEIHDARENCTASKGCTLFY